jgi:hypothetical protein
VDADDEPLERPVRPRGRRRRAAYVALQEQAWQVRRKLAEIPDNMRSWDDGRRSTSFVPASDTVVIDVRRHPFMLVWPLLRTVTALVVLLTSLQLLPLLAFAAATAVWARVRFGSGLHKTAVAALAAALALLLVTILWGTPLVVLLLVLWAAEDVADWLCDRLVVTNKRIYRRYGVLTRHAPSIALTAIAFIDAAVPPIGRVMSYGTLRLDSVAQRDAPLARLDLVPDVIGVSHEILRLRSQALPKFPPLPS